jgi:hypothetical protein
MLCAGSHMCVELAIRRWTRHHVHNAHHVSSTAEEKAPPGHCREHTSRSILDIRGLASQRNQDAQPMVIIDHRVAGPTWLSHGQLKHWEAVDVCTARMREKNGIIHDELQYP